jgi:hypothetical protein
MLQNIKALSFKGPSRPFCTRSYSRKESVKHIFGIAKLLYLSHYEGLVIVCCMIFCNKDNDTLHAVPSIYCSWHCKNACARCKVETFYDSYISRKSDTDEKVNCYRNSLKYELYCVIQGSRLPIRLGVCYQEGGAIQKYCSVYFYLFG